MQNPYIETIPSGDATDATAKLGEIDAQVKNSLNVDKLKAAAPILQSFTDDEKIRVAGGVYELKSGRVRLAT